MRFRTTHFAAGDLDKMTIQKGQDLIPLENQRGLEAEQHAYTAWDNDEVIACFGITMYWPGRGFGWTFISKAIGSRLRYVTKVCREIFETCGIKRIEAAVACDFEQGHRWMKLLGMELECRFMRAYLPDGRDGSLYARVT